MVSSQPFKWRNFQAKIFLLNVRWYCRYPLSYRNLEEMMLERGLEIDHSTINRWVLRYSPDLDRRCRPHLKPTNDYMRHGASSLVVATTICPFGAVPLWRVDETYVKVKKQPKYLYRAVDSKGNTLDFLLTAKRDANAAKRFFIKALKASHTQEPRVINMAITDAEASSACLAINVDKNPSYPPAIEQLKKSDILPEETKLRQVKCLNNMVEQDPKWSQTSYQSRHELWFL